MKILHIVETLKAGGKERQLLELVRGLLRMGVDTRVVVQSDSVEYDVDDIQDRVHRFPRRTRWDLGMIVRLRKFVDSYDPDVIHSWGTMPSIYAIPISGFGKRPLVAGHIRDAPTRLSRLDKRWWHGKIAEPFAQAIVANSNAGLAAYRPDPKKAQVIYNGFDFANRVVTPSPTVRKAAKIYTRYAVGMVARFGKHKDHATFFAAAERLLEQRDDVTFVCIGDGSTLDGWRERYRSHERIILLGRRSDVEEVVAVLTCGVLLTNVGDHGEGISNALVEFLAAAKPVIATDDGGNRELVAGNRCGFLVPPSDAGSVVSCVNRLLNQPDLRIELGKNGQKAVRDLFSQDAMVAAYVRLYDKLMAVRQ